MSEPGKMNGKAPEGAQRQRRLGNRLIGERLREMYDGVVQESVPDEFLQLLEQAEQAARNEGKTRPEGDA
ncbi:NepR family anti-sigma factor [Hyphomonas sp.]|uniref:NepR family anti-sigma factor n=1 Tax=Hyphomonas sp. TaxID=87 RepID=UPI00391B1606